MSNNVEAGACSAEICKTNSEIVQLRLDFTSFVISNPANGVATSFALLNGERSFNGAVGVGYSINGQCNEDSFTVTSPGPRKIISSYNLSRRSESFGLRVSCPRLLASSTHFL